MLGVLVQLCTTYFRARKDFTFLRTAVTDEIATIAKICNERRAWPAERAVVVPPLPNAAWHALRISPFRSRVSKSESASWEQLYRAVDVANAQAAVLPQFLQIASLSPDKNIRQEYLNKAIAIIREPLEDVVAAMLPGNTTNTSVERA